MQAVFLPVQEQICTMFMIRTAPVPPLRGNKRGVRAGINDTVQPSSDAVGTPLPRHPYLPPTVALAMLRTFFVVDSACTGRCGHRPLRNLRQCILCRRGRCPHRPVYHQFCTVSVARTGASWKHPKGISSLRSGHRALRVQRLTMVPRAAGCRPYRCGG